MKDLAAKSRLLTGYLELLVSRKYQKQPGGKTENKGDNQSCVEFLTPHDPKQRGASLSLKLHKDVLEKVYTEISKRGVVCEKWPPHVIRMAPAPMYCSFQDIRRFMKYFTQAMEAATASAH
nr:hypothetical protein BaRGS_002329 [Batillaria attramentaria]